MPGKGYFQDELEYLKDMRRQAAREHWEIARAVGVDTTDPDVERLFEGFAFLTGRLREKLDDEFPEIVQSLLGLWWPHFLRPVPAMSILEFQPIANAFSETRPVPAGTEVQSRRVDGSRCRFRTSAPVSLHPMTLEHTKLREQAGGATLELDLSVWPNAAFSDLAGGLRLYLGDSLEKAADLYRLLLESCAHVDAVFYRDGDEVTRCSLPGSVMQRVERCPETSLLPETGEVAGGYLGLQEYFSFPEQQMFVTMKRFGDVANTIAQNGSDRVQLVIAFDRFADVSGVRDSPLVHLNCVPIANLFAGSAKPIALKGDRSDYNVTAESKSGMHCELYSIDSCTAYEVGSESPIVFHRFESFGHQRDAASQDYFQCRYSQSPLGQHSNAYLSFVRPGKTAEQADLTVAVDLTCTNGNLPFSLAPGDIDSSTTSSPEFARFTNLTRPTRLLAPPLGRELLWQLVANMSINYTSLLRDECLQTVLRTYDFPGNAQADSPAARRTSRILDSLRVEETGPASHVYRGLPVRGVATTISTSRSVFGSAGMAYAFGRVLDDFLGSFAGLNSFHQLTFKDRDSDEVYQWPPQTGNRALM